MRSLLTKSFMLFLVAFVIANCSTSKKKILIIGDSISIGYTPFVKTKLADKADVFHNQGNAQHTGRGLEKVEEWIEAEDWDIIQFNWGLWDLCYRHPDSKVQGNRDKVNGKLTYTIEDYATNLDAIVNLIKAKTDATLIFVTTSFVPGDEAGRFSNDPIRYNQVAKKIMQKHAIAVNDIYEASIPIHEEYGKGTGDVHYSEQGYEKLSEPITSFLLKSIN